MVPRQTDLLTTPLSLLAKAAVATEEALQTEVRLETPMKMMLELLVISATINLAKETIYQL